MYFEMQCLSWSQAVKTKLDALLKTRRNMGTQSLFISFKLLVSKIFVPVENLRFAAPLREVLVVTHKYLFNRGT